MLQESLFEIATSTFWLRCLLQKWYVMIIGQRYEAHCDVVSPPCMYCTSVFSWRPWNGNRCSTSTLSLCVATVRLKHSGRHTASPKKHTKGCHTGPNRWCCLLVYCIIFIVPNTEVTITFECCHCIHCNHNCTCYTTKIIKCCGVCVCFCVCGWQLVEAASPAQVRLIRFRGNIFVFVPICHALE